MPAAQCSTARQLSAISKTASQPAIAKPAKWQQSKTINLYILQCYLVNYVTEQNRKGGV